MGIRRGAVTTTNTVFQLSQFSDSTTRVVLNMELVFYKSER